MKRAMCIHLPKWPLQRLYHDHPSLRDKPVVLYDSQSKHGSKVVLYGAPEREPGAGRRARAAVRAGMPVAEANAIVRGLQLWKYDPAGDLQALRGLADWASRFSPFVSLADASAPESLLLDITGCAPLFRGEEPLLDQVDSGLIGQGWKARLAIADTIGAAWAIALYTSEAGRIASPGQTEQVLRPLPVAALRLPDETVRCLRALGVESIGELMDLPRSSVPARLGPMVLERLDQALGHSPEVLVPYRPPPEIDEVCPFEWPTDRQDVLNHALGRLTDRIHEKLRQRHQGARKLECWLCHENTLPTRIELGLSRPSRSARHLRLLLSTRLERVALPGPVSALRLYVSVAVQLDDAQPNLLDDERAKGAGELSALIDQLSSRLGREAVTSPRLVADAQPECACRYEPAIQEPTAMDEHAAGLGSSAGGGRLGRPLRLWPDPVPIPAVSVVPGGPPVQFRWVGVEQRVAHSWGPERIETGWWRGDDVHRDYYVVETTDGSRFWIFRRRDDGGWFLHGCFD
jgi:protein ImuB